MFTPKNTMVSKFSSFPFPVGAIFRWTMVNFGKVTAMSINPQHDSNLRKVFFSQVLASFPPRWGNPITIHHPPETMDLVHPANPTCFLYSPSCLPSLKLTACPWQWTVGRRSFPFGIASCFKQGYLTPCPYFYNWELALWRFAIESRQCRWTKICLNVERIRFRNSISQFEQWSKPRSWLGYLGNITEIYGLWWATVRIPMNPSVQWLLLVWTGNAKKNVQRKHKIHG